MGFISHRLTELSSANHLGVDKDFVSSSANELSWHSYFSQARANIVIPLASYKHPCIVNTLSDIVRHPL